MVVVVDDIFDESGPNLPLKI